MVDPGVPLGPGLLATWVPLQGPHTKNANARINTATIAANFRPLTLPSRSLFRMQSPVLVVHTLLHATELGLNKTCRTLFRQTCRDFDPQAVVARPAACRRGTAVRSACGAQGRRDGPVLSTDARHAPEVVMRMLLAELDSLTRRANWRRTSGFIRTRSVKPSFSFLIAPRNDST